MPQGMHSVPDLAATRHYEMQVAIILTPVTLRSVRTHPNRSCACPSDPGRAIAGLPRSTHPYPDWRVRKEISLERDEHECLARRPARSGTVVGIALALPRTSSRRSANARCCYRRLHEATWPIRLLSKRPNPRWLPRRRMQAAEG